MQIQSYETVDVEQCIILHNNLGCWKKGPLGVVVLPRGADRAVLRFGYDGLCVRGDWKVYV